MDLKQSTTSTNTSTLFAEMTPVEAVLAVLDPPQRILTLYLEKSILCPSQKHVVFVGRLIDSLSANKCFQGTATLEPPQYNPHPSRLLYFNKEET